MIIDDEYISTERLLGRKQLSFDPCFTSDFKGAKVMITGAGGTLGTALTEVLYSTAASLILVGHGENSLFNLKKAFQDRGYREALKYVLADCHSEDSMREVISEHKPDYVIHCAAHKHVDMLEDNVVAAYENNVEATRSVVEACSENHDMKAFILISTDKAVDPISVYGKSKFLAEKCVLSHRVEGHTRFLVIRLGNILGSRGSVIGLWKKELATWNVLTVTDFEATRYFITPYEAAMLVLSVAQSGISHNVYIARIGAPIAIRLLAERCAKIYSDKPFAIIVKGLTTGEKKHEDFIASNEKAHPSQIDYVHKIERL